MKGPRSQHGRKNCCDHCKEYRQRKQTEYPRKSRPIQRVGEGEKREEGGRSGQGSFSALLDHTRTHQRTGNAALLPVPISNCAVETTARNRERPTPDQIQIPPQNARAIADRALN